MPIDDITGNLKSNDKAGGNNSHNKKTPEVYLVKVFRVEKQVGDAHILPKAASNHGEHYNPAQEQVNVSSEIIEQKLDWEAEKPFLKKKIKTSEHTCTQFRSIY